MTGKTTPPGETATETHTDYVSHGGYRFAILTLTHAHQRPATLGSQSLASLAAAVRAVDPREVDAVAVCGTGSSFCAGADLKQVTAAVTPVQARNVARQGLEAFGLLEALPVPTFAFINGTALGGGLELALHMRYRVAADSVRALGFPEVRLGLVPGWGGIPRAVALLGPTSAARLVVLDSLAGKNLSAHDAAELGLVDAVLPREGFLSSALDFAGSILAAPAHLQNGTHPLLNSEPAPKGTSAAGLDGLEAIRTQIDDRFNGAAPAPYRALELIAEAAAGVALRDGEAAEVRAFGDLVLTDEARASIYAFHLTRSLAKNPAGRPSVEPLPVRAVGILGAGLMASQLALTFALQLEVPVRITDLSQDRVDNALRWVDSQLDKLVDRAHIDTAKASALSALVTGGTDKRAFADCDVVIEAVFEELEVKQAVFAEVEPHVRPDTLLLTNTSSLSVENMGTSLARPERLVGFHFFNPVAVLPLVEIVTTPRTDQTTLATAFELAERLRKTPVLVTDTAGFVVNRILTRLFSELFSMLDVGNDPTTVNHALDPLGLPMTPLQLLQFIGPTVQLHILETMHQKYPQRFSVSTSLKRLVAAGLPGFLDDDGSVSPAAAHLLPAPTAVDESAVRGQLLAALAEEITVMLREGVVAGPEQIDLCMILGANYPFHTGGLTPLLDRETCSTFHPQLRTSQVVSR